MNLKKVIHLVPYDGTGGVETAARSMLQSSEGNLDFNIEYIFHSKLLQSRNFFNWHPISYLQCARRVIKKNPDLIVVSLWRSCIVTLIIKIFSRRSKLVLFLHYPGDVHIVDKFFTKIISYLAEEVWADSKATLEKRLSQDIFNTQTISFVTSRITPITSTIVGKNFIFWGRLHKQKNLAKAITTFYNIHLKSSDLKFFIIGPDGGEKKNLLKLVEEYRLQNAIIFLDAMPFSQILEYAKDASFYLQTSILEGMGMSVVEAMQLGLIPVVTPVGEIENYCIHGQNSVLIEESGLLESDLLSLFSNPDHFHTMRANAIQTWANKDIYHESFSRAALKLLK